MGFMMAEMQKKGKAHLKATAAESGSKSGAGKRRNIQQRRGFELQSGDEGEFSKYQSYMQDFNMEKWLDALEGLTMETKYVPMEVGDAEAIIEEYDLYNNGTGRQSSNRGRLGPLTAALEETMQGLGAKGASGCFVKTSSRSAKDHADSAKLKEVFRWALHEQLGVERGDENLKMAAMSYASMEQLRMRSGEQVMSVFTESKRIWDDMHLALNQYKGRVEKEARAAEQCEELKNRLPATAAKASVAKVGGSKAGDKLVHGDLSRDELVKSRDDLWGDQSLVVREWVEFEPDMEFRCFVRGGKLVAVSQVQYSSILTLAHSSTLSHPPHTLTHSHSHSHPHSDPLSPTLNHSHPRSPTLTHSLSTPVSPPLLLPSTGK
jgi:hypothetical protein